MVTELQGGEADAGAIPGCRLEPLARPVDERGWFTKPFQASSVAAADGEASVAEVYLSSSHRGVVRGLHLQLPPHHHAKTVTCVHGLAYDVVVDLRVGSPAFGLVAAFLLRGDEPFRLHIPSGVAHGFQALVDDTVLVYVVGTEHAPDHDGGVRYDSVGATWPLPDPVISARDLALPPLPRFDSPFRFPRMP